MPHLRHYRQAIQKIAQRPPGIDTNLAIAGRASAQAGAAERALKASGYADNQAAGRLRESRIVANAHSSRVAHRASVNTAGRPAPGPAGVSPGLAARGAAAASAGATQRHAAAAQATHDRVSQYPAALEAAGISGKPLRETRNVANEARQRSVRANSEAERQQRRVRGADRI